MRLFILLMAVAVISVRIIEGEETTLDSGPPELSWDIMPGKPNVLTLNLTQSLSSSVTLLLSTTYAEDEELQSSVFFTLLASNYSSSWSISPVFQKHAAMLCFASRPVFHRATLVARVSGNDTVKVRVGQVRRIIGLDFGVSKKVVVSPGTPATFLVDPVSGPDATSRDRYFLRVRSLDDHSARVCAIVAAYAKECPFKDGETSVRTADMWFTALSRGAMTIRYERFRFNMPFFVSVVVMGTDDACHLPDFPEESVTDRTKRVVISIERTQPYTTYLSPIGYSLFLSLILVIFAFVVMSTKRLKSNEEDEQQHQGDGVEDDEQSVYYSPNTSRDDIDRASSKRRHLPEDEGDVVDDGADGGDDNIKPMVVTAEDEVALRNGVKKKSTHEALKEKCLAAASESTRLPRIRKGLERLNQHARLTDMTRILEGDVWFRRNRSRVYCYLVPLLSLFYFIPSIQFVFLVKQSESLTGSQDLCFHNFECAHPLNIFSDFNHVVSNTSYVIFGLAFLIIVRYKAHLLPESQKPKNDHRSPKGILQQLSVFYAMGFALAAQGFFSVCYHVCPTNHSLQFDSTMMYVMCMLGMVKIYQFRHPDANANAYSFFYFLGGIVLVEALALYSESWWIYGVFILFYVIMTIFIAVDCYYMGVARLDGNVGKALAKDILIFGWKDGHDGEDRNGIRNKYGIRYPQRFAFALLFCLVNLSHAAFICVSKVRNPRKSVTHIVLLILAGNLILYISYYVFRKNKPRCQNFFNACRHSDDSVDARYSVRMGNREIPVLLSAGSFFALAALVMGILAVVFYTSRNANRNLSPAESRNLNEPCSYMGFFDNHDLWHFTSAAAIFMAFLALLTVDDDLLTVPRNEIEVF